MFCFPRLAGLKFVALAVACTCVIASSRPVDAQVDFSFTGSFSTDDDLQLIDFSVDTLSTITLKTLSYAGGVNAEGLIIEAGGFDAILSLFDADLNFIDSNDDGSFPDVGIDPITGSAYDPFLELELSPGDYSVAVTQYDNFFAGGFGDNISLGFAREGEPDFTFTDGNGTAPMFNDVDGDARTSRWAFDTLNVSAATAVPEPSPASLLLLVSAGLFGRRRKA